MTTLNCAMFLLVVAVFCVHVECHHSKEKHGEGNYGGGNYGGHHGGGNYGGHNYGGHHYGGENYGAGGGHYAIGFTPEEIAKMCPDNAECQNCYDQSQNVSGDTRFLKVANVRDCFTKYSSTSGWMSNCADYATDMLEKYSDKLPPTVQNMVSFCARTSLDFSSAGNCNPEQSWKEFYTCFAAQGSKKSGEDGKKGEEKRRRAAEIPLEGGPYRD